MEMFGVPCSERRRKKETIEGGKALGPEGNLLQIRPLAVDQTSLSKQRHRPPSPAGAGAFRRRSAPWTRNGLSPSGGSPQGQTATGKRQTVCGVVTTAAVRRDLSG